MRQILIFLGFLAILALAVLLAVDALACPTTTLTGSVTHIRDGDTLELEGRPIRLEGISAPERHAPGADKATEALRSATRSVDVSCALTGQQSYDRCVAVCYVTGTDLGEWLVRAGLAIDCPRYSGGRYALAEQAAINAGIQIEQALPSYCLGG